MDKTQRPTVAHLKCYEPTVDRALSCGNCAGDGRARADWALLKVSLLQDEFLDEKKQLRLTPPEGLGELCAELQATRQALAAVKLSSLRLQEFVEGCKIDAAQCGATSSDWNLCAYVPDSVNGSHAIGVGAILRYFSKAGRLAGYWSPLVKPLQTVVPSVFFGEVSLRGIVGSMLRQITVHTLNFRVAVEVN